ncbi:hypothetical protein ES703_02619 [subsurface metagenome]
MAKLLIMRKTVKTRYAANGRDRCTSCSGEIKISDKYTTTGGGSVQRKKLVYCRACAEEKNIL